MAGPLERLWERMRVNHEEIYSDDELASDSELTSDKHNTNSNPLKLPLGWDGMPIPYWLYKLHGLQHEFKCEICGDRMYRGRREFERHFGQARHQCGLRCLGIPNSHAKSFHEITLIADARKLWDEIQRNQKLFRWNPDLDEEFEDDDGNVYDYKTYHHLKRQRLI